MNVEKETTKKTFGYFEKQEFKPIAVEFTEFEELPPAIYEKIDELDNLGDAISRGNVSKYFRIDYEAGGSCYIFPESDIADKHVYIVDLENGEITGYLVIELDADKNPQVADTETFTNQTSEQKQGRGTRRLWIAKKIALQQYGQPLHSGAQRSDIPRQMWEKLEHDGFATLIGTNEDGEKRWRMN